MIFLIDSTNTKNIIISWNIPPRWRLNWQCESDNLFEKEKRNTWLTFCTEWCIIYIRFYNKNSRKLIPSHSLHHNVPSNHVVDQWHLCKCMKFKKNGTNIKSSTHHLCWPWWLPRQDCNITEFYLSPTHTPFSSTLIGCHAPLTHFLHVDWPSSSAIHYIFTTIIWYSIFLH